MQRDSLSRSFRPSLEALEGRWVPANVSSPNQNFVDQLYRDALHRAPDPGAQGWVQGLDAGQLNRSDVAVQVLGSQEGLRTRVNDLYVRYLGRQADPGGLNYWTNFLRDSHSDTDLGARLLGSQEFFQTQGGGTNAGFLNALYQDVLGRTPSQGERNDRSDDLNGGDSRDEVAQDVLETNEARGDEVQNVFASYLRRSASGSDRSNWSDNFNGGRLGGSFNHSLSNDVEDNKDLLFEARVFGSQEYFQLAQTLPTTSFATIPAFNGGLAAPGTPGFTLGGTGTTTTSP